MIKCGWLGIAKVAFLNLVILFLLYNFYVCFNLNYIVVTLWCLVDDYLSGEFVIVMRKHIDYVIFFSLGPIYIAVSIGPVQISVGHLLEPDFHVFHRQLFPFANQ